MTRAKSPDFLLKRVYADGTESRPRLRAIQSFDPDWTVGRRGFLTTAAAAVGLLTGARPLIPEAAAAPDPAEDAPSACSPDIKAHRESVSWLGFTPDGAYLVSFCPEDGIKLWEMPAGALAATWDEDKAEIKSLAVSPDGKTLAVGGPGEITLRAIPSGETVRTLSSADEAAGSLAFTPDGESLLAGGPNGRVTVWTPRLGITLKQLEGDGDYPVTGLTLSADHGVLAGAVGKGVSLWNLKTGKRVQRIPLKYSVEALAFDPLGIFLVIVSDHRHEPVRIYDVAQGRILRDFDADARPAGGLAFTMTGPCRAITGMHDGTVVFWRIPSGTYDRTLDLDTRNVHCLAVSPDGSLLAAGTGDKRIILVDLARNETLTCLFDKDAYPKGKEAGTYTYTDQYGRTITGTQPCGTPIPAGAICTCNCVPGGFLIPRVGGTICTCNQICVCVPVK